MIGWAATPLVALDAGKELKVAVGQLPSWSRMNERIHSLPRQLYASELGFSGFHQAGAVCLVVGIAGVDPAGGDIFRAPR